MAGRRLGRSLLVPLLVSLVAVRYAHRHRAPAPEPPPAPQSAAVERVVTDRLPAGDLVIEGEVLAPAGGPPPAGTKVYLARDAEVSRESPERWRCLGEPARPLFDEACDQAAPALQAALQAGLGRVPAERSAATDDGGRFRFEHLPPGDYALWTRVPRSALALARGARAAPAGTGALRLETQFRARLAGLVVAEADARPMGQVVVRAFDARLGHVVQGSTDPRGRFELDELAPGAPYMLLAEAPGFAPAGRRVRAGEEVLVELLEAASVSGVVTALGGKDRRPGPAAGARVELDFGLAEVGADARGAFRFDGLRPGRHVLLAEAGPNLGRLHGFELARGVSRGVQLELAQSCPLSVAVVDQRGLPLNGAELRLNARTSVDHRAEMSGPTGKVELPLVTVGSYELVVSHPDRTAVRQDLELAPPCSRSALRVVLPDGPGVRGRTSTEDGAPLPHVALELWPEDQDGEEPPERRATSDELGRFEIPSLRSGRWLLRAKKPGHVEELVGLAMAEPRVEQEVELTLARGSTLAGRLLDPLDQPVAGWRVSAALPGPSASDPELGPTELSRSVETGPDGRFVLEGLAPGSYLVSAAPPPIEDLWAIDASSARTEAMPAEAGGPELTLRSAGSGVITGVVRFVGAPAPESFTVAAPGAGAKSFDGARGRFVLEAVAGSYPILITAHGFSTSTSEVQLERGRRLELELTVHAARELAGRVVDAQNDEPLGEATVAAWLENGDELATSVLATTRRDGRFELRGLAPGAHHVSIHADGYAPLKLGPISLADGGQPARLDVRLERARVEVEGRVLAAERPLAGAALLLSPAGMGAPGQRGVSNTRGGFRFEAVTPGDHVLTVASRRRREVWFSQRRVHVPMSGLTELEVETTEPAGSSSVEVELQGRRRGPVLVTLRREAPADEPEQEASWGVVLELGPGRVRFEDLMPGAYSVAAGRVEPTDKTPLGLATGSMLDRRAARVELGEGTARATLLLD